MHSGKHIFYIILVIFPINYFCEGIERYSLLYTIQENTAAETLIGTVSVDLYDRLKSTSKFLPKLFNQKPVSYSLGTQSNYFYLSSKNGKLFVKSIIDVDEICMKTIKKICHNDYASLEFNVNLWLNEKLVAVINVIVNVLDVNDNQPHFPMIKITIPVNEINHKTGRKLYLPQAIDNDSSEKFSKVFYGLSMKSSDFELLVDQTRKPYLKLLKDFDCERQDFYTFLLQAWNHDMSDQRAHLSVTIEVKDFNDNEPNFTSSLFKLLIPENTPLNSKIFQLTATDPDKTAHITYSMDPSANHELRNLFKVKSDGGVWLENQKLDYETTTSYTIPVMVSDGIYSNTGELKITLQNVNDEPPKFSINPSNLKVVEKNTPGLSIGQVTVFDADDESVNGKIICHEPKSIEGYQDVEFHKSSSKEYQDNVYEIKTKRSYDREFLTTSHNKDAFIKAILICTDGWGMSVTSPRLTSTLKISIFVEDINDNAPQFDLKVYNSVVPENSGPEIKCVQVNAHDKDTGENAAITFSLLENEDFKIDAISGWISARHTFDRELKSHYLINVVVRDKGEPSLSSTALVNVTIMDLNDNAPELIHPTDFNLMENQKIHKPELLGVLNYEDRDEDENGRVTFSKIWPYDNNFILNPNGSIYYNSVFDRETQDRYCMSVRLQDHGYEKQHQTTGTVCVKILDQNDNEPIIKNPKGLLPADNIIGPTSSPFIPIILSIYETPGFKLTTIEAKDDDYGDNGKVTYSLETPLGMRRLFKISSTNGDLTLDQTLSKSDIGMHRIRITVQDHGKPPLFNSQVAVIKIEDQPPSSEIMPEAGLGGIFWIGGKNLLVVIILSTLSVILIVILITAILCLLKPCREPENLNGDNAYSYDTSNRLKKYCENPDDENIGYSVDRTLLSSYTNNEMINQPQILLDNYIYHPNGDFPEEICVDQHYQQWPVFQASNDSKLSNLPNSNFNYCPNENAISNNIQILKFNLNNINDTTLNSFVPISNYNTNPKPSSFGHPTSLFLSPMNLSKVLQHDEQQSDSGRGNSDDDIVNISSNQTGVIYQKIYSPLKPTNNCNSYTFPKPTKTIQMKNSHIADTSSNNDSSQPTIELELPTDKTYRMSTDPSNSTDYNLSTNEIKTKSGGDLGHLCDEINDLFFKKLI